MLLIIRKIISIIIFLFSMIFSLSKDIDINISSSFAQEKNISQDAYIEESSISKKNYDSYKKGIIFYALGNEPFWNIDFYNDKIIFKALGLPDSIYFDILKVDTLDYNLTYVAKKHNADTVKFLLKREKCFDGMSDTPFSYSINFELGDSKYKGVGRYVINPSLNDIWLLKTIDGKAENNSILELLIRNQSVLGTTNKCQYTGVFYQTSKNSIFIDQVKINNKDCSLNSYKYSDAIKGEFNFKIENRNLILKNKKHTLVFLKVD